MLEYRKLITPEQIPLLLVNHLVLFGPELDKLPEKISKILLEIEQTFHENIRKFATYVTNLKPNEVIRYNRIKKYLKLAHMAIDELIRAKKSLRECEKNLAESEWVQSKQ